MSMDTERTFTPADIAKELDVTTNSIRNWTRRYAEYLSDSAAPKPGAQRALTQRDRIVLAYINGLLKDGHRHEYIATRLAETSFSDDEATPADLLANVTTRPLAVTDEPSATQTTADASAYLALIQRQDERSQSQDERIRQLEDTVRRIDNHTRLIVAAVAGIVAGAVIVGILAALVMLR